MKAIWNNQIIAESDETIVVEGNHYFPPESVKMEFLNKSDHHYTCPWKQGTCDYYNVEVNGKISQDGAWVYPETNRLAKQIEGRFAFWHGVEIAK